MSSNNAPGMIQYTIQAGDSLWGLANRYNSTVEEIMAANPGLGASNLWIGQVIAIPDPPQLEQRREFRRPEREFRRPEREFRRRPEFEFRRPFRFPYYVPYYPYVPYAPPAACPYGAVTYAVQPGDSIYSIAARFGKSVDAIVAYNPYVNFGYPLQTGQIICIPGY